MISKRTHCVCSTVSLHRTFSIIFAGAQRPRAFKPIANNPFVEYNMCLHNFDLHWSIAGSRWGGRTTTWIPKTSAGSWALRWRVGGATRHPASSACSRRRARSSPSSLWAATTRGPLWCPAGPLPLPTRQPFPSLPLFGWTPQTWRPLGGGSSWTATSPTENICRLGSVQKTVCARRLTTTKAYKNPL